MPFWLASPAVPQFACFADTRYRSAFRLGHPGHLSVFVCFGG